MFTELLFTALLAQAPSEATLADHRGMMRQLGITALRPGPGGRAGAPNPANYGEALANPYPKLPPLLRRENGKAVRTRRGWERRRRPELVELFEREVIGRVPAGIPPVQWEEVGREGATRKLIGRVGPVEMAATLTLPAHARRRSPVMILFTFRGANPQAVEELTKGRLGLCDTGAHQRAGRQRRGADQRHHRLHERWTAAQARGLGCAAGLGLGRFAASGLPRNRARGGCAVAGPTRQLSGGSGGGPNWQHFVPWAERMLSMQGQKQQ